MSMKKLEEADIFTFAPADLAQLTAVPRSVSVARTILSPSSSSYYKMEEKVSVIMNTYHTLTKGRGNLGA